MSQGRRKNLSAKIYAIGRSIPLNWRMARLATAGLLSVTLAPYLNELYWKAFLLRNRDTLGRGLAVSLILSIALIASLVAMPRVSRWLRMATLAGWITAHAGVAIYLTGPLVSKTSVVAALVLSGLWQYWLAWMPAWPMSRKRWWAILAMLIPLAYGQLLLRADGLTGDGRLNVIWRYGGRPRSWEACQDTQPSAAGGQLTALPIASAGDDYPQFLGPTRSGVVAAARLTAHWSSPPPRLVWQRPVGAGWGGFAVVGGRAVTQEQRGDEECVVCYRLSTGQPLWCHADKARFDSSAGLGPRATPTITGDQIYTLGAAGLLNCLDLATGRPAWSINILADNGAENLAHGVSGSPLVVDDMVIVSPTGKRGPHLAAYDRHMGHRLWQAGQTQAGYGSPVLATLAGRRQIVLYDAAGVAGHEPQSGRLLWSYPWANHDNTNCTQPLVDVGGPDQVLLSTGYGKGSVLLRLTETAGELVPSVVWQSRALRCKFGSPVLCRDLILGLDEGVLVCLDPASGRRLWKGDRYHFGQLLAAGDLLLVQSEGGAMFLIDPRRDGPQELGHFQALEGKAWNTPALAGPFLLVRDDIQAACYMLPHQADVQGLAARRDATGPH